MKSYRWQFLLTSLVLSLCACGEDFFEQTVKIDLPEHEPQLAITAQPVAGDTAIWAFVSVSQGILDDNPAKVVDNAIVELFRNGQLLETLPYFQDRFYLKSLASPLPSDNAIYELKVSAPGFDPVSARQQMPVAVPILSVTYEAEGAINLDGERVDEITVEFQDPAGQANIYRISMEFTYGFGGYTLGTNLLDPIAEDLDDGQYIKDVSFDGKKYSWRVGVYPIFAQPGQENKIHVTLHSVSSDHYFYERSVYLNDQTEDNPFSEPVIIHSNVEGGLGIFSLASSSVSVIEL